MVSTAERQKVAKKLAEAAPKLAKQRAAKSVVKLPLKIKSDFVFMDVTTGRAALRKITDDKGQVVPVIIRGIIIGPASHDDGISQEFEINVEVIKVGTPRAAEAK